MKTPDSFLPATLDDLETATLSHCVRFRVSISHDFDDFALSAGGLNAALSPELIGEGLTALQSIRDQMDVIFGIVNSGSIESSVSGESGR